MGKFPNSSVYILFLFLFFLYLLFYSYYIKINIFHKNKNIMNFYKLFSKKHYNKQGGAYYYYFGYMVHIVSFGSVFVPKQFISFQFTLF